MFSIIKLSKKACDELLTQTPLLPWGLKFPFLIDIPYSNALFSPLVIYTISWLTKPVPSNIVFEIYDVSWLKINSDVTTISFPIKLIASL